MSTYYSGYLIETDLPADDELAILHSMISLDSDYLFETPEYLLPCLSASPDKMNYIYLPKGKKNSKEIRKCLQKLFGEQVKYAPLDCDKASVGQLKILRTLKKLQANNRCNGHAIPRFTTKTPLDVIAEINAMPGFSAFKAACENIFSYHHNAKNSLKKANYNIALVINYKTDKEIFIEHIYDLYLSLGIISDPLIVTGDVDDAFRSKRDTSFLFCLEDEWCCQDGGYLVCSDPIIDKLRKLDRRDTIYITVCDEVQYKKLREVDSFQYLFPQSIEIDDITREEKACFLQREIDGYGLTCNKDLLSSHLLDCNVEQIRARVSLAVRHKMSVKTDNKLTLSDFVVTKKKAHQKSAYEQMEELVGLNEVKSCIREIATFLKNRGHNALPCLHMVFRGNPGTGKTTVARLIGKILGELGVLKHPDLFIEADRSNLVSRYLGATAGRTASVVKKAQGGAIY